MRCAPGPGATLSHLSIGLGVVGFAAAAVVLVEDSVVAALTVLAAIIFHLALGWRIYRLSRLEAARAHTGPPPLG